MSHVRVLLASKERLLRETLRERIRHEAEIDVVGEVGDPVDLLLAVGERAADVVVLFAYEETGISKFCSHLFCEYPELLVIRVSDDGHRAYLSRQMVVTKEMTTTTVFDLMAAIRQGQSTNDGERIGVEG